ncbi:hypothetical protein Ate01nite_06820 [Actinoplanes teichomyceticus]|nr:hypothetical protein Ate01nite_06820 [Actinoplanes teichomyceticus]
MNRFSASSRPRVSRPTASTGPAAPAGRGPTGPAARVTPAGGYFWSGILLNVSGTGREAQRDIGQ